MAVFGHMPTTGTNHQSVWPAYGVLYRDSAGAGQVSQAPGEHRRAEGCVQNHSRARLVPGGGHVPRKVALGDFVTVRTA